MTYQHRDNEGNGIILPVNKVVCIGRNYLDHIQEMNSVISEAPLLFMKPRAAMCDMRQPVVIPSTKGDCHNELEIAVLLKSPLKNASEEEVYSAIWGLGLGLDLTLREVQTLLKEQGQPWERAKSFDRSAPLTGFVPISRFDDLEDVKFSLSINGETRQQGHTALMLHKIIPLIAHMSSEFALDAGDVILTGTPKGVGPLRHGDNIEVELAGHFSIASKVIAE